MVRQHGIVTVLQTHILASLCPLQAHQMEGQALWSQGMCSLKWL